jgi:Rod binding domain-containing protein
MAEPMKTHTKLFVGGLFALAMLPSMEQAFSSAPSPTTPEKSQPSQDLPTTIRAELSNQFVNKKVFGLGNFTLKQTDVTRKSNIASESTALLGTMSIQPTDSKGIADANCALAAANQVSIAEAGSRYLEADFAAAGKLCLDSLQAQVTNGNITNLVQITGVKS